VPQIFDNVTTKLSEGLAAAMADAVAASFCVGYLNLRGWQSLAHLVDALEGGQEDKACRLLIGMHRPPEEELRVLLHPPAQPAPLDWPTARKLLERTVRSFLDQLRFGVPTAEAEQALRTLQTQLRHRRVFVKVFLRYPLHAKLYLVRRRDPVTPLVGFVGSSNLTMAGLSNQGELNVDVVEQDAAEKLQRWFDRHWEDKFALDLTERLLELLENSWASERAVRPYLVYLKMAYHLSEEAREGLREFKLPKVFDGKLLDFQKAAVSLAARILHQRGGVLLGDVVGLGKTLMATAVARLFQEDQGFNTLVICPPALEDLWDYHFQLFQVTGKTLSIGKVLGELKRLPRYRLVIIDESHTLRNREGKRYRAIADYIEANDAKVLLVTATPYNKQYLDIANQLRLFLDEEEDLRIRPERFFRGWLATGKTEHDFIARFQTLPSSLRAFEKSEHPEDWRDLMRLFLVRRTRAFIKQNYAQWDPERQRYYVLLNGQPHYFPVRQPKKATFKIDESDPRDQYAKLYTDEVVQVIESLALPRYGLANYLKPDAEKEANGEEQALLANLNRAGRRLVGFCRSNLFKRLESSGHSFLLSLRRHVLRNCVTLYALLEGLPLPIGTQDAAMLDEAINDQDEEFVETDGGFEPSTVDDLEAREAEGATTFEAFFSHAATVYEHYCTEFERRFAWLSPKFFNEDLRAALEADTRALLAVLQKVGPWQPSNDAKLQALAELVQQVHRHEKVLVFSQFADTACYLYNELRKLGVEDLEVVTGESAKPVDVARRFSPSTNGGLREGEKETRVLLATDVLAEGQNLQDCHIVVNYDLPWAIIRLIQRAGRVDRIGQRHDTILVYSFLPAEGVERIIRLRARLYRRLQENQEVIGTDESFFGEGTLSVVKDLYTEKAGVFDEDQDEDVDISSVALHIWNSASEEDRKAALALPQAVYATRTLPPTEEQDGVAEGVVAYYRYPDGLDALVHIGSNGEPVSRSVSVALRAAACPPDTPPAPARADHHALVAKGLEILEEQRKLLAGSLGHGKSTRKRLWRRLEAFRKRLETLPQADAKPVLQRLDQVSELVWRYPLTEGAEEAIGRQLRLGISDEELLAMLEARMEQGKLCQLPKDGEAESAEPMVLCSLGLVKSERGETL
jgi:superfamily II DNA or RNA helicase